MSEDGITQNGIESIKNFEFRIRNIVGLINSQFAIRNSQIKKGPHVPFYFTAGAIFLILAGVVSLALQLMSAAMSDSILP